MPEDRELLREIFNRMIVIETEFKIVKDDIRDLKATNKQFAHDINKITLDYQQAKGAIQIANWIALAVIALTAGLGGIWLSNSRTANIHFPSPTPYQK